MIKAIVFDCFGVLVGKGFEYTYRFAGGDPKQDKTFINETLSRANLGLISDYEFRTLMSDKIGITTVQWVSSVETADILNTDLLGYIEELSRRYKTAILSNANKGVIQRKIGKDWLDRAFDLTVVSAETGIVKPDPNIYKMVCDRLDVRPDECVYIDDNVGFTEAASNVGMKALAYKDFESLKRDIDKLIS